MRAKRNRTPLERPLDKKWSKVKHIYLLNLRLKVPDSGFPESILEPNIEGFRTLNDMTSKHVTKYLETEQDRMIFTCYYAVKITSL